MSALPLIRDRHDKALWSLITDIGWYVRDARRLRGLPVAVTGLDVHAARARWVGRRLTETIKGSADPEGVRRFAAAGVRWLAGL